ncbi:MAG: hypothetical protein GY906_05820 [bacterium]|nr:hypothetical protein [bacterium]
MTKKNSPETEPVAAPEATQLPPAPPQAESLALPSTESNNIYEKAPGLAAFLSLIPGLGYLYVGAYQRAVMIVVSVLLTIYLLPLPISVFAPIFIWFFGMFDSYRQAQIANLGGEQMEPQFGKPTSNLAFGVFLAVVGALLTLNNFFDIDLEWLADWWPMLLFLVGIWVIINAIRERKEPKSNLDEEDDFSV